MLGCETLYDMAVALATKRGTCGPTTLCKEGLTWECTIATLALVRWSTLDLAAIQEGGDGRDGMLLDCSNPSQMLWKPSYYLVRGSSLDGYPCRLDGWIHSIGLGGHERGGGAFSSNPSVRSHKSTEAVG